MKRAVIFFLSFILVCTFLIAPVSASSNSDLINLLDYQFINEGAKSNIITAQSSNNYLSVSLPYQSYVSYFDILLTCDYPVTGFVFRHTQENLNIVNVGGNMYRIYGRITPSMVPHVAFDIKFSASVSGRRVEFVSFNVNCTREAYISEPLRSLFAVYHRDDDSVEEWLDSSETSYEYTVNQSVFGVNDSYTFMLGFPDWQKYDYIDVMFSVTGVSLPYINAYLNEQFVPYEMSYVSSAVVPSDSVYGIDGLTGSSNGYLINMRLYLDGFDRTIDDYPVITIGIQFNTWSTAYYNGSYGCIYEHNVSPIFLFWRKLESKFDELIHGNDSSQNSASSFQDSVSNQSDELSEMSDVMNSVEQPNLSGVNFELGGMVSTDVVTLSTAGLSSALSNGILSRLLMMVLTLAIAGYILYGKK